MFYNVILQDKVTNAQIYIENLNKKQAMEEAAFRAKNKNMRIFIEHIGNDGNPSMLSINELQRHGLGSVAPFVCAPKKLERIY